MKKFVILEIVVIITFVIGVFVGYLWFKPDDSYQNYYKRADAAWTEAENLNTPPVTLDDPDVDRIRKVRAAYRTVFDDYPDSRWADDAMYHMAAEIARTDEEAFVLYRRLINDYSHSEWADDSLYLIAMGSYRTAESIRTGGKSGSADLHYERAYALFSQLIRDYPGSTLVDESRLNLELCHYGKGNLELALEGLQRIIEDFRDNYDLYIRIEYRIGHIYTEKQDYDNARKYFERVVLSAHTELSPLAKFGIAQTQFAEKRFEDAIKIYQDVIDSYPESESAEDAHFYIGWAFDKLEKYDEAIIQLETAIEKYPHNEATQNNQFYVAQIYFKKNDADGAIQAYRKVADNTTFDYDARRSAQYWIGWIYEDTDDVNQAVMEYKKLLKNFLEPHRVARHPSNNISENYIKDLESRE